MNNNKGRVIVGTVHTDNCLNEKRWSNVNS